MIHECSTDLLAAALAGALPPVDEDALQRHLDECESCAAAMEKMAGGAAWCEEAAVMLNGESLDGAIRSPEEWSDIDFTVEHLQPSDEPNVLGRLAGYDILEVLGRGGMGVVLKAFDRDLKRCVAIKTLAPHLANNSLAKKRFAREAQAAAAVVHPNVLAIHHVQPNGPLPFLVMPLVAGESLAQRLKAKGTLDLREILRIGMQAAAGLAAAHDQGLVHRDVKPANILLEFGVERTVLTDFGLARAADDVSMTRWGVIAGTPEYMSPEQAKGEPLDGRSDLFSLGCVLYEMATGVSPFRTNSVMATMRRLVDDSPQPMASLNPELPPWFISIVDRLLEKDPSKRFGSAKVVSELLEGCLAHLQQPATVALPESLPKSTPKQPVKRRFPLIFGAIAMLSLLGLGSWVLMMFLQPEPPRDIVFGPTIERKVKPCDAPDFPALNLETGTIVKADSAPNLDDYDSREQWRKANDAHVVVSRNAPFKTYGFVELRSISSRLWDQPKVSARDVWTITASTDSGPLQLSNTPDPATYSFRTKNGTLGMLQLNPNNRGDGVIIRYKLALSNDNAPPSGEDATPSAPGGVELIGLADYPSKGSKWYRPDGSPLSKAPVDGNEIDIRSNLDPNKVWRTALFRVPGGLDMVVEDDRIQRVNGNSLWAGRQFVDGKPASDLAALAIELPVRVKKFDLTIRTANGVWHTAEIVDATNLVAKKEWTNDGRTWRLKHDDKDLVVSVDGEKNGVQRRVTLRRDGQLIIGSPQDFQNTTSWKFKDVGDVNLHSFILQTRNFKTSTFRDVAVEMNPRLKSTELFATKEQIARIETLLKKTPSTTRPLAELWELEPGTVASYRPRAGIVTSAIIPVGERSQIRQGVVHFIPQTKTFYVQWDNPLSSQMTYYGPFHGEPRATLGLNDAAPEAKSTVKTTRLTGSKEQVARFELFLKKAPSTTKVSSIADLYELEPGTEASYRLRKGIVTYPIVPGDEGFEIPLGTVYMVPQTNRFYVQWDRLGSSQRTYYGPFEGDPAAVLGLRSEE